MDNDEPIVIYWFNQGKVFKDANMTTIWEQLCVRGTSGKAACGICNRLCVGFVYVDFVYGLCM